MFLFHFDRRRLLIETTGARTAVHEAGQGLQVGLIGNEVGVVCAVDTVVGILQREVGNAEGLGSRAPIAVDAVDGGSGSVSADSGVVGIAHNIV